MKTKTATFLLLVFISGLGLQACSSSNKYACGTKAQKKRKNKSLKANTNFFVQ